MYELLYGQPPYRGQNHIHLVKIIERSGPLVFPIAPQISPEAADLLTGLLQKRPQDRISFADFFNHPFLLLSQIKTTMIASSAPKSIHGPSSLSLALSRKASLSASPLVKDSSLGASALALSSNRFTRVIQEEELIDLAPADVRASLRRALVLAEVATDAAKEHDDHQEFFIIVLALESLLESIEAVGNSPLQSIISKKITALERQAKRIPQSSPEDTSNVCVNLDDLLHDYAVKLALEAGFKELLGHNSWRVYCRAASLAQSLPNGNQLYKLLQDRL